MRVLMMAAMVATLSTPAFAQDAEVNYREGALGFEALQNADYERAEEQLLEANGVAFDRSKKADAYSFLPKWLHPR